MHGLPALRNPIIVNDEKPPLRQPRVKILKGEEGRRVEVAVQPDDRESTASEPRERLVEPPLDKLNLTIENTELAEQRFDLGSRGF